MKIFIEYSQRDYRRFKLHTAEQTGGIPGLVLRGIMKLGKQETKKRCANRCKKVKRQYAIPEDLVENLQAMSENEGVSVAMLIQKRVIIPLINSIPFSTENDFMIEKGVGLVNLLVKKGLYNFEDMVSEVSKVTEVSPMLRSCMKIAYEEVTLPTTTCPIYEEPATTTINCNSNSDCG